MNLKQTGPFIVGTHTCKGHFNDISSAIIANNSKRLSISTQIFTHGPQTTKANKIDVHVVNELSKFIKIFVHAPYCINIFNKKENNINDMVDVFKMAAECGAIGVVIHLPRATIKVVIESIIKLINKLDEYEIVIPIILETPSNKPHPTMSWESPEKLRILDETLTLADITTKRVGICIDTAHIFAGGAEIQTCQQAQIYLQQLPAERIHLFHLNGNEYENRAGDKHAIPLSPLDKIWGSKKFEESGCSEFVKWARKYTIPIIFEQKPDHSQNDIDAFIKMCGSI